MSINTYMFLNTRPQPMTFSLSLCHTQTPPPDTYTHTHSHAQIQVTQVTSPHYPGAGGSPPCTPFLWELRVLWRGTLLTDTLLRKPPARLMLTRVRCGPCTVTLSVASHGATPLARVQLLMLSHSKVGKLSCFVYTCCKLSHSLFQKSSWNWI